ncbi:MAG: aminopeptidase, partial [bacterium]|nr:aminopeptidase [bacterium]
MWLRKREEVFHFSSPQKPSMVRFDYGNYLLKEWTYPKSPQELLFQLKNDDIIGRGWAAMELGKLETSSPSTQALKAAA